MLCVCVFVLKRMRNTRAHASNDEENSNRETATQLSLQSYVMLCSITYGAVWEFVVLFSFSAVWNDILFGVYTPQNVARAQNVAKTRELNRASWDYTEVLEKRVQFILQFVSWYPTKYHIKTAYSVLFYIYTFWVPLTAIIPMCVYMKIKLWTNFKKQQQKYVFMCVSCSVYITHVHASNVYTLCDTQ